MILASGGFGADFGADSLLATYRPDLLHLPTTNGEHCTGTAMAQRCFHALVLRHVPPPKCKTINCHLNRKST